MIKDTILSDILNKKGGKVTITGKVFEIVDSVDSGEPFIVLSDTTKRTECNQYLLRCFFKNGFPITNKGDIITIKGRINGAKFPFIDLVCCSKK
jgi:hypothetical protein